MATRGIRRVEVERAVELALGASLWRVPGGYYAFQFGPTFTLEQMVFMAVATEFLRGTYRGTSVEETLKRSVYLMGARGKLELEE